MDFSTEELYSPKPEKERTAKIFSHDTPPKPNLPMAPTGPLDAPQDDDAEEATQSPSHSLNGNGSTFETMTSDENKSSVPEKEALGEGESASEVSTTRRRNERRTGARGDSKVSSQADKANRSKSKNGVVDDSDSSAANENKASIPKKEVMVPNGDSVGKDSELKENGNHSDSDRSPESPQDSSGIQKSDPQDLPLTRSRVEKSSPQDDENHPKPASHAVFDQDSMECLLKNLDKGLTKESLDEDAIALKMIQTDKIATERTRQLVLETVCSDSEDEEDEFTRAYEQEMNQVLALDNFKHAVRGIDKKSANWLRRSLGMKKHHVHVSLHPPNSPLSHGEESDDQHDTATPAPRRLTRNMLRTTRIRKREERVVRENQGLEALLFAVKELEGDHGTIPVLPPLDESEEEDAPPRKRSRLSQKQSRNKKELVSQKGPKQKRQGASPPQAQPIKRMPLLAVLPNKTKSGRRSTGKTKPGKTVKVIRIVVNGRKYRDPISQQDQEGLKRNETKTPRKSPPTSKKLKKTKAKSKQESPRTPFLLEDESSSPRKQKRRKTTIIVEPHEEEEEERELPEGRLFDELLQCKDFCSADGVMSLSLLDWRRRQHWTLADSSNMPGKDESIKLPARIVADGIDTGLPLWENVNPIARGPREPSSQLEPSRRRHNNATYASWCSKLINCLNGSGRMMAHHEFFYSDIDRAWYNSNEFQRDMAILGIPPTMKLTRSEWSLVRRKLRKRPRRFSKKFILNQFSRLNLYRSMVRKIQQNPDIHKYINFGYDVPAPIRVGATVTAFNKRACILHRGLVLAHDVRNHRYLVQFERKDLGCEFCPDADVASHGVPEILVHTSNMSLDGSNIMSFSNHHVSPGTLAFGTSYGQLKGFRSNEKKQVIQQLLISSNQNYTHLNAKNQADDEETGDPNDRRSLVEKVAEREILVRLIGLIETTLHRKQMLLEAMSKFHETMKSPGLCSDKTPFEKELQTRYLKEHYAWLHANLGLTNQSLESSLVHLQVMYSKGYAGTPYCVTEYDEEQERNTREHKLIEASGDGEFAIKQEMQRRPLVYAVFKESAASAHALVSRVSTEFDSKEDSDDAKVQAEQKKFLMHRLTSAAQFLMTMNYGCESSYPTNYESLTRKQMPVLTPNTLAAALEPTLVGLRPSPLAVDATNNTALERVDDERHAAFRELEEAMSLFESELTAQRACESLNVECRV